MDRTLNLDLPYIAPSQAQKHITHNEAISRLDDIIHISVIAQNETAPPETINEGDRFIVGESATGNWVDQEGKLAIFRGESWDFITLKAGWIIWDIARSQAFISDGENLLSLESYLISLEQLGINTQADSTNKLAIKSDAVLMSHDDVTPGSGDMRLAINKEAHTHAGSLIFQNGFSGRAELGLSGSDDMSVKVSPNGQDWKTAIEVNRTTGEVSLPHTPSAGNRAALVNYLEGSGRFAGASEPKSVGATSFSVPSYINPMNGSVFEQGEKFIHNNTSYGGSAGSLDPIMDGLISKLRNPNSRRFGPEFYSLKVTSGTGTAASPVQINGQAHYLTFLTITAPIFAHYMLNYYLRVISGAVAIGGGQDIYFDGTAMGNSNLTLSDPNNWTQVTLSNDMDTQDSLGYHSSLFRIYATPGTIFHLALPALMTPGIAMVAGENLGLVPSANLWL